MDVSLTVSVLEVAKSEYSSHDRKETIFKATIEGSSTKDVEEKVGKLQQAVTHMGWKLD